MTKATTKPGDIAVTEKKRTVFFKEGQRRQFDNTTMFNADGSWLRLQCDVGYVMINTPNVNFMVIDGERVR